jgi:hypothetical protein
MAPAVTAVTAATAAALATSAAVAAATACWLALCRLAAWRRRRTRVAGDFFPPDPPKGSRKQKPSELANPYVKKGGHGGPGRHGGSAKGTSQLEAQRGIAKRDEREGQKKSGRGGGPGKKPMGRPIRLLMTVLLLPLRGEPGSPQWGAAQDEWNARHILGPPTADGVFREPPGQPTAAQRALESFQVPGFFSAKVAWWENWWAR